MDKRQKILIVDDAEFNRVILKEILGETYNYLEAENGNQAIRSLPGAWKNFYCKKGMSLEM